MRMERRFFPVAVLAVAIPATASTIVGGEPIAIAEAPWQVLLDGGNCGGSWIGKNWVVTAVHCVASGGPDGAPIPNVGTFVNAGITRKSEADANNRYLPRKLHFPPGTKREWNTFIPDIALIELDRDITAPAARPIRLITRREAADGLERVGVDGFITGWGRVQGGASPDPLQGLLLKVAPGGDSIYISVYKENAGPCHGDSGGPLAVKDAAGQWILAGVANNITGRCGEGDADNYARVSRHLEWLDGLTGNPVRLGKPGADRISIALLRQVDAGAVFHAVNGRRVAGKTPAMAIRIPDFNAQR
jgi:secreted trypsin-like serine protease